MFKKHSDFVNHFPNLTFAVETMDSQVNNLDILADVVVTKETSSHLPARESNNPIIIQPNASETMTSEDVVIEQGNTRVVVEKVPIHDGTFNFKWSQKVSPDQPKEVMNGESSTSTPKKRKAQKQNWWRLTNEDPDESSYIVYESRPDRKNKLYVCSLCKGQFVYLGALSSHKCPHYEKSKNDEAVDVEGVDIDYMAPKKKMNKVLILDEDVDLESIMMDDEGGSPPKKSKKKKKKHVEPIIDVVHVERRPRCDECGKLMSNENNLKRHKETVHCKEPWITCERCKEKLRGHKCYKNHMVMHDMIDKMDGK